MTTEIASIKNEFIQNKEKFFAVIPNIYNSSFRKISSSYYSEGELGNINFYEHLELEYTNAKLGDIKIQQTNQMNKIKNIWITMSDNNNRVSHQTTDYDNLKELISNYFN